MQMLLAISPGKPYGYLLRLRLNCGVHVHLKPTELAKTQAEAYEMAKRDVMCKVANLASQLAEATDFYERIDQMSLETKDKG